jgi:C_GCAxxG_C_C family probable redox protein
MLFNEEMPMAQKNTAAQNNQSGHGESPESSDRDTATREFLERIYSLGFEYEKLYRGCAQCSFAALQDGFGVRCAESDAVFKSATGLSGGVGNRTNGHCGAYSGSVMMIGYLIGRERDNFADPDKVRRKTTQLAGVLHDRFIAEYGTVICSGIHTRLFGRPYYILDRDEARKFDEAGAHDDVCTSVVGRAARWTAEILIDAGVLHEHKDNSKRGS